MTAAPSSLLLEIRRTTPAGIVRRNALSKSSELIATWRLENGVFQPSTKLEVTSTGKSIIQFPNPRTLQITIRPAARRVLRGVPVAVFSSTQISLRFLAVNLDETAVALVGDVSQSTVLGESTISISGESGVYQLRIGTRSRPFAFPLAPFAAAKSVTPARLSPAPSSASGPASHRLQAPRHN